MISKPRVLIIDDSTVLRHALGVILQGGPATEAVSAATVPQAAWRDIVANAPNVVVLDNTAYLRRLLARCPNPAFTCSSLAETGMETLLAALETRAADVILKPRGEVAEDVAEARMIIEDRYFAERNFDVIFLRNILINFDKNTRNQVLVDLRAHLRPGGYLVLGHCEAIADPDRPGIPTAQTGAPRR